MSSTRTRARRNRQSSRSRRSRARSLVRRGGSAPSPASVTVDASSPPRAVTIHRALFPASARVRPTRASTSRARPRVAAPRARAGIARSRSSRARHAPRRRAQRPDLSLRQLHRAIIRLSSHAEQTLDDAVHVERRRHLARARAIRERRASLKFERESPVARRRARVASRSNARAMEEKRGRPSRRTARTRRGRARACADSGASRPLARAMARDSKSPCFLSHERSKW